MAISGKGDFLIRLLRSNKPIQDPENPMHQLLHFGVGLYLDFIEDFTLTTISKINIFNNIPNNDTEEWEELVTAGLLKLYGDEIEVYRKKDESNNDYRNRLLSYMNENNSIRGIANIVGNVLDLPVDSYHIDYEFLSFDPLEFGDLVTNLIDNTSTDILVSLLYKKEPNLSTITITLPDDTSPSDVENVYSIVWKMLWPGIKLIVTNGVITL